MRFSSNITSIKKEKKEKKKKKTPNEQTYDVYFHKIFLKISCL